VRVAQPLSLSCLPLYLFILLLVCSSRLSCDRPFFTRHQLRSLVMRFQPFRGLARTPSPSFFLVSFSCIAPFLFLNCIVELALTAAAYHFSFFPLFPTFSLFYCTLSSFFPFLCCLVFFYAPWSSPRNFCFSFRVFPFGGLFVPRLTQPNPLLLTFLHDRRPGTDPDPLLPVNPAKPPPYLRTFPLIPLLSSI